MVKLLLTNSMFEIFIKVLKLLKVTIIFMSTVSLWGMTFQRSQWLRKRFQP